MKTQRALLSVAIPALLAACSSSHEQPVPPAAVQVAPQQVVLPGARRVEDEAKVLTDYALFQSAQEALKRNDASLAAHFLQQAQPSAMAESLRRQWLNLLGKNRDWATFAREYALLPASGRDLENRCYAVLGGVETNYAGNEVLEETGKQPEGCNRLLETLALQQRVPQDRVWRRVRGLLAANQIADARQLAAAAGSPLPEPLASGDLMQMGGQEAALHSVIGQTARRQTAAAATRLQQLSGHLKPEQVGFAWGVLGHQYALNQEFHQALAAFNRADRAQLDKVQWEWYARSALRLGQWMQLGDIIRAMPSALQADPTWQYWLGRSHAAAGNQAAAETQYRQAAASGRNFYALLALEALGGQVDTRPNTAPASDADVAQIASDGAVARALTLFHAAQRTQDWTMRRQAQAEWRYALANFDEAALLAASKLAHDNGFYEMGIYAADRTNRLLDYGLRYIAPFQDITSQYAAQARVDTAWVYGLIRQESRFMLGVRSRVGATGLMQVMPATAQEIANKIGMSPQELHTIEGNIRMGTWYLGNARDTLGHEVLATAGYNAGPGRARRWQANVPLEGAVYAETIPFDETRDYVKRVMANATYYASLFNAPQQSLTRRMGTIAPRR